MHDQLIFHRGLHQAFSGCVSAMKSHPQIADLVIANDRFVLRIHILGHGVVDIQQSRWNSGRANNHVFAERAVNIRLAGCRNALGRQAGVQIAGNMAEMFFKSRPAFIGKCRIGGSAQIRLHEFFESAFILS